MKKSLASKLLAFAVAASMSIGFVGCRTRTPEGTESIDTTKTQLYVSSLKCGLGNEWLDKAAERFETAYADERFENGKIGVQVILDKENTINGAYLILPSSDWEVFFNENVPFNDYVSQGQLLDISDVVKNPAYGEDVTIESKLSDTQKAGLSAYDGKYYVLPHYEAYRGLSYNVKVFEDNRLFFAKDKNNANNGFIITVSDERSPGPNGVSGDYDDGLPATAEEFFKLCDKMVSVGVTPFVWPGANIEYSEYIVDAFAAAYMGAEEFYYNYSFDSGNKTTEVITGFNGDDPIIEEKSISTENGYLIRQQAGKYYGYQVFKRIIDNIGTYVYPLSDNNSTFTHYDAQEEFLSGEFEGRPIGMICDGNYWWNEAGMSGAYDRTVGSFGDKAREENREFAWMPLPGIWSAAAGETPVTQPVLTDLTKAYAFINANIADKPHKVKLAKEFLSFCYTDDSLREFTRTTGVAKGLNYQLESADYEALSSLGKSCWQLREKLEVVHQVSANRMFIENQYEFTTYLHDSTVSGAPYRTPMTAFKANVSAKDYFMGTWIDENDWKTTYGKYFTSGV